MNTFSNDILLNFEILRQKIMFCVFTRKHSDFRKKKMTCIYNPLPKASGGAFSAFKKPISSTRCEVKVQSTTVAGPLSC